MVSLWRQVKWISRPSGGWRSWAQLANCLNDSLRSHGSRTQLIDYWREVIGWNTQWRKYRELVNCLDSSFFTSKWKRTHLSSLTPCLPGSAQVQVKCLSGQSCSQLRLPASCPYQVDIIDKIEKFSYCKKTPGCAYCERCWDNWWAKNGTKVVSSVTHWHLGIYS